MASAFAAAAAGTYFMTQKTTTDSQNYTHFGVAEAEIKRVFHNLPDGKKLLDPNVQRNTLMVFYDSKNPLQAEFLNQMDIQDTEQRLLAKNSQLQVVYIDISKSDEDAKRQEVLDQLNLDSQKLSSKRKPTIFLRSPNQRVTKLPAKSLLDPSGKEMNNVLDRETNTCLIWSVRDLVDSLQKKNTELDSTTIVYCYDNDEVYDSQATQRALAMMRNESRSTIMEVRDKNLAKVLKMQPGKFYCYFKPSFVNGLQSQNGPSLNFEFAQAMDGAYRDEFTLNEEYLNDQKVFGDKLFTDKFINDNFTNAFTRSFNVDFAFNPSLTMLKRKIQNIQPGDKPIMIIYYKSMFMEAFVHEFQDVLNPYRDVFDIYYIGNEKQAKDYFITSLYPDMLPCVTIIDPDKKIQVENENKNGFGKGQYQGKYTTYINFQQINNNMNKFIDSYLDGNKLEQYYWTQNMVHESRVKTLNSATFKENVMDNPNVNQFLVEVFNKDCPACAAMKPVFAIISLKMERHGYIDDLPCFRLENSNEIPYLGNFGYAPMYLYVRKDQQGKIAEIKTLKNPFQGKEFLNEIGQLSKLPGFNERVRIHPRKQREYQAHMKDRNDDFDIDFDLYLENQEEKKE